MPRGGGAGGGGNPFFLKSKGYDTCGEAAGLFTHLVLTSSHHIKLFGLIFYRRSCFINICVIYYKLVGNIINTACSLAIQLPFLASSFFKYLSRISSGVDLQYNLYYSLQCLVLSCLSKYGIVTSL